MSQDILWCTFVNTILNLQFPQKLEILDRISVCENFNADMCHGGNQLGVTSTSRGTYAVHGRTNIIYNRSFFSLLQVSTCLLRTPGCWSSSKYFALICVSQWFGALLTQQKFMYVFWSCMTQKPCSWYTIVKSQRCQKEWVASRCSKTCGSFILSEKFLMNHMAVTWGGKYCKVHGELPVFLVYLTAVCDADGYIEGVIPPSSFLFLFFPSSSLQFRQVSLQYSQPVLSCCLGENQSK